MPTSYGLPPSFETADRSASSDMGSNHHSQSDHYSMHHYHPHQNNVILQAYSNEQLAAAEGHHHQQGHHQHLYFHPPSHHEDFDATGLAMQPMHEELVSHHHQHQVFYHPGAHPSQTGHYVYDAAPQHHMQLPHHMNHLQHHPHVLSGYALSPGQHFLPTGNGSNGVMAIPRRSSPSTIGDSNSNDNETSSTSSMDNSNYNNTSNNSNNAKRTGKVDLKKPSPSLLKPLAPGQAPRRVYACTIPDCPKTYGTGAGLRYHLKTWHKTISPRVARQLQKPANYRCTKCAKCYSSAAGLRYHNKNTVHTPEQIAHAAQEAVVLNAYRLEHGLPLPVPLHPNNMGDGTDSEVHSSPELGANSSADDVSHVSGSDYSADIIVGVGHHHYAQHDVAAGSSEEDYYVENSEYIDGEDFDYTTHGTGSELGDGEDIGNHEEGLSGPIELVGVSATEA